MGDHWDGKNRNVCAKLAACEHITTFSEIKQKMLSQKNHMLGQLHALSQSRRWSMTFEACVMGLMCRISHMNDVLLLLDENRPLLQQIDLRLQLTLLSDVAIYLFHLFGLLETTGNDWSKEGMLCTRPMEARPTSVMD